MLYTVLLLCGLGFQSTLCTYIRPGYFGRGLPLPPLPYNAPILPTVSSGCTPLTLDTLAANRGGSFKVFSSSPVAPTGISIFSENTMKGALYVAGEIPFLGAVVLDGSLPAAGSGAVDYECGSTAAVLSEGFDGQAPVFSPTIAISPCASIELAVPASIPAEIVAPACGAYGAFPSASVVLLSSSIAPKATAIAPVIGRFRFGRNFGGFGLGYR